MPPDPTDDVTDTGDPGDTSDDGDATAVGVSAAFNTTVTAGGLSNCTATFVAAGQTILGLFGAQIGGEIGVVLGGGGGTLVEPGGGTVVGGLVGGAAGAAAGGFAGYQAGGAIGGWLGGILCSQGKGERGTAAKPTGTANPGKHAKPDPNRPGAWLVKDPHTGKWIPKPMGWRPQ
jgi:hypothetical protein